jgi:hypothetical protein
MKLGMIFGPPAVGKMTVGYALERLTGLRLLHHHMTIDLILPFFAFGHPAFRRLGSEFRTRICEEVAGSALPGLLFTYVWVLDRPQDKALVDRVVAIFRARGADICFVELTATPAERLQRHAMAFRLAHKPSKRKLERSRRQLIASDQQYHLNFNGDFFYPDRHLKLENTALEPDAVAQHIAAVSDIPVVTTILLPN